MIEQPFLLELEPFSITRGVAVRKVEGLLSSVMLKPNGGWHKAIVSIGNPTENISYRKLVDQTALHGYNVLQLYNEADDDIFGVGVGMTTPDCDPGITITVEYAGHKQTLKGPYSYSFVEWDLSEDILAYRHEACLWSNDYAFTDCIRNYRAYLFSCVALVDAFINRHIIMYEHRGNTSQELHDLKHCPRLEDRMELFLKVSANKGLSAINGGKEWNDFKQLRSLRNSITHISTPTLAYHLNDFAEHFNMVRTGVGGLLKKIRDAQKKPSLCFIDRLMHAPIAYSNSLSLNDGVRRIVKRNKILVANKKR